MTKPKEFRLRSEGFFFFKIEKKRKTLAREKEDREFTHRETEYETAGEACIIA